MRPAKIEPSGSPNPIDESAKRLFRDAPGVLLRLLGRDDNPAEVRFEDCQINAPELRADHVIVRGQAGDPTAWALYLEYQLKPEPKKLPTWFAKSANLGKQLGIPAPLLVIYLERGKRASFPTRYVIPGPVRNVWVFARILLWEYRERIRSGELWELAPLLILCEDFPTEETLREEIALITAAPLERQADLLAVALRVAGRDFPRSVVEEIFRKELPMARGASIVDDWIAEAADQAEARGEARGEVAGARALLLSLLRKRFGDLPAELVERIHRADRPTCEMLAGRAVEVESLREFLD